MAIDALLVFVVEGISQNTFLAGLTILVMFGLVEEFFLFKRLKRLVKGGDGKSLEGTIRKLQERVSSLEAEALQTADALRKADARIVRSIQGVSLNRFDPFQNASGLQSFATALLSEKGNGVVISGIHARDGVRVYAKPVTAFESERELSEEERSAIVDAKKSLGR